MKEKTCLKVAPFRTYIVRYIFVSSSYADNIELQTCKNSIIRYYLNKCMKETSYLK